MRNIHPVDELAENRLKQKALQEREVELRRMILAGECSEVGDAHLVRITRSETKRLDTAGLKELFGEATLAPYMKSSPVVTLKVVERSPEELTA